MAGETKIVRVADLDELSIAEDVNTLIRKNYISVIDINNDDPNIDDSLERADSAGGGDSAIVTKTANYTATLDDDTILVDASGGVVVITLPAAASAVGHVFTFIKIDISVNLLTVNADGSELINGALTQTTSDQWARIAVQSNGTAWYQVG